jgi:D-glycero-D-manno-heptose 1,7-bisphosphate phosphatase
MIVKATRDHPIDLSRSFLIGDKEIDVDCAHNAGVRAIRVRTGMERDVTESKADWVANNVPAAVQIILNAKS